MDFDMYSCPVRDFSALTLAHHIWHIGLIPWVDVPRAFDVDPYLKINSCGFFRWLCVRATVLFFDIVILYLASQCITIGQCVTGINDICMTLTFGLNITIIFSPWIFVWARSSLFFDIDIPNFGLSQWDSMCTFCMTSE